MTPARRLVLPILVSLFLIISLFAAKQALAVWIFDFDPPAVSISVIDANGQIVNQNGIVTTNSITMNIICNDGINPWNSGCKELTYKVVPLIPEKLCEDDKACDQCIDEGQCTDLQGQTVTAKNKIKIVDQINLPPGTSEFEIQYWGIDKAGNKSTLGKFPFNNYPYKIQGYIWIDNNRNEVRDVNPEGKFTEDCYSDTANITLSGTISGSTTYPGTSTTAPLCDTYRYYSFNVPTGTYRVTLTQPSGYFLTGSQTWAQSVTVTSSDVSANWGITDARVWWQTKLGDVRAGVGTISDTIPASCKGQCKPYVSLNSGGMHGIVFYAGSLPDFGNGSAAETPPPAWLVNNSFSGTLYTYDWIDGQVSQKSPFTGAQPAASGVYKTDLPETSINSAWTIAAGQKIVILVNGNLNINQTIDVAAGGFLAFYVKGNINVAGDIGSAVNQDTPQLEGIYVADGSFNTGSSNKRLNIEGTVVAASFSQGRDVLGGGNKNPSFYVSYRPDFLLSAPPAVQSSSFIWQEIAP